MIDSFDVSPDGTRIVFDRLLHNSDVALMKTGTVSVHGRVHLEQHGTHADHATPRYRIPEILGFSVPRCDIFDGSHRQKN